MILLGHAKPFYEPIVAYGPFVMNTPEEIRAAYDDYRTGKFGLPRDLSPVAKTPCGLARIVANVK